jgi:flagellar basal body P-ring formation protein FlgA
MWKRILVSGTDGMRPISAPFHRQLAPTAGPAMATLVAVKKCHHRVEVGTCNIGRGPAAARLARAALAACAAVATGACAAQTAFEPDAVTTQAALALVRESASALAPAGARITASAGALDARLRLAACARVEPYLVAGLPSWGATRVGLRCTSGPVHWRAFLPVQVQVLAPAWTSRAALPAGALVANDQWEVAETDWAASPTPPIGALSPIAGHTLARPVQPGQALREADLLARRWFSNGQSVRIVAAGPGFSIQGEGLALGHGIEGQPVRVRTEAGRVLTGRAVGESLVEVRP